MSDIELYDDEWAVSSGLPLADADVEIVACTFGFNAKIGTDALCANFTFQPVDGGDLIEQSFSVGKGWEAANGGAGLVTEDGRKRSVNGNTNYGRLISSAIDAVRAAGQDMPFQSPRLATGWVGTQWHVGTTPVVTTNPSTGVEKIKDAFVFTHYIGADATGAGEAAEAKAPATGGKPAAKAKGTSAGIDADLLAKLTALAGEHADHDAFVEAAYEIPGVDGVKDVERAILKSGAGSIWAEAQS